MIQAWVMAGCTQITTFTQPGHHSAPVVTVPHDSGTTTSDAEVVDDLATFTGSYGRDNDRLGLGLVLGPDFGGSLGPDLFIIGPGFDIEGVMARVDPRSPSTGEVARYRDPGSAPLATTSVRATDTVVATFGSDGVRTFAAQEGIATPRAWLVDDPWIAHFGDYGGAGADLNGDGMGEVAIGGGVAADPGCGTITLVGDGVEGNHDPREVAWARLYSRERDGTCLGHGRVDILDDLTGDGDPDLVVAGGYGNKPLFPGSVFVVPQVPNGMSNINDVSASVFHGDGDDNAGIRGLDAGDLDGDGSPDLIVSGQGDIISPRRPGRLYVIGGPLSGEVGPSDAFTTIVGESERQHFASDLRAPGDTDGDGFDDLLVSALDGVWDSAIGEIWLFHGPLEGTLDLEAPGVRHIVRGFTGAIAQTSDTMESLGDLDGDGTADIALGR
ncbi:MAG: VCBS repeat-containing protein, partial [Alphaproteobacteria bacterium]|nr:VCBS repeat-containing protein [Alphaproteobacteria bacterium]